MIRLAILFLGVSTLLAGCNEGPDQHVWNQRTTVIVETPDGLVEGSSVIEVRATCCPEGGGLAGDIEVNYRFRGEAVAVEAFPDEWLLLLNANSAEGMYHASPDQLGGMPRSPRCEWLAEIPNQTEPVELLVHENFSILVAFDELDQPHAAVRVTQDNIQEVFGPGVRIRAMQAGDCRGRAEFWSGRGSSPDRP